jgi:hypothetical protein
MGGARTQWGNVGESLPFGHAYSVAWVPVEQVAQAAAIMPEVFWGAFFRSTAHGG